MPDETGKAPSARDLIRRQGLMDDMMDDMMGRCSVDLVALIGKDGGQSYVEARSRCRGCASVGTCHDWLLMGDGEPSSEPQEFCPNSGLFRILLGK